MFMYVLTFIMLPPPLLPLLSQGNKFEYQSRLKLNGKYGNTRWVLKNIVCGYNIFLVYTYYVYCTSIFMYKCTDRYRYMQYACIAYVFLSLRIQICNLIVKYNNSIFLSKFCCQWEAANCSKSGYRNIFKGPAHSKNENLYFLAPAQTKRKQPILVSCEALFRSNLQKKNTGLERPFKTS